MERHDVSALAGQQQLSNPQKIKVLHVITALETGGAEGMLYKLLRTMVANQDPLDHYVLTLVDSGKYRQLIKDLGIPVYSLDMKKGVPSPKALWKGRQIIREIQPNVVQGWMYHGNLLASMIAPKKVKVFWNIRQTLYSFANEKWHTKLAIKLGSYWSSRVNGVIYNSHTSIQQHQNIGYSSKKTIYIPNGFDSKDFYRDHDLGRNFRMENKIPLDKEIVGIVGRYHPMKGHLQFLEIAKVILNRCPDIGFVMVGKNLGWENQDILSALEGDSNLKKNIWLLEEKENICAAINSFDVLALTSNWGEAFPNVVGESLFCCTPVVSTDVGDVPIIYQCLQLIVPRGDVDKFAETVIKIVETKNDQRPMFERLFSDFRNRYDIGLIADVFKQCYYP